MVNSFFSFNAWIYHPFYIYQWLSDLQVFFWEIHYSCYKGFHIYHKLYFYCCFQDFLFILTLDSLIKMCLQCGSLSVSLFRDHWDPYICISISFLRLAYFVFFKFDILLQISFVHIYLFSFWVSHNIYICLLDGHPITPLTLFTFFHFLFALRLHNFKWSALRSLVFNFACSSVLLNFSSGFFNSAVVIF